MAATASPPDTLPMPAPRRMDLSDVALTATLLSVYAGARGTARAIGVVQLLVPRR